MMALIAALYDSVGVAWVMSMWCAINLIMGYTFWKPATVLTSVI